MDSIEVSFPGEKRVDARFKGFVVHTDQSVATGGSGTAPSPYDLFLASVASCAGYYVLAYCLARSIPTTGMRLVQRHEWDPTTQLVTRIQIEIQLPPGFPDSARAPIVRAAQSCKVKKSLGVAPTFEVLTVDAEPVSVAPQVV